MATELTHFIGGKHVKGTSGRFADGFQPMTGEVISKVPLASKAEVRAAVENALAAPARLGGDQSAAPRARADEVPRTASARDKDELAECSRANTARPSPTPRAISSAASKSSNSAAAFRIC